MTQAGIPGIRYPDKEDRGGSRKLVHLPFYCLLWLTALEGFN